MKIATPVSHLFDTQESARVITELSDCLELREQNISFKSEKVELFHCDLEPTKKWKTKDQQFIYEVISQHPNLQLISFHLASCYEAPVTKDFMFLPGGNKLNVCQMKQNAQVNLQFMKENFEHLSFAIENNNYYPTDAYEYICNPHFINEIVNDNNLYFLLDIAHAKISAHNLNLPFYEYMHALPLSKIIQIHITGYQDTEKGRIARDEHLYPSKDNWSTVKKIISRHRENLRYLTVEYYSDYEKLLQAITELKQKIQ